MVTYSRRQTEGGRQQAVGSRKQTEDITHQKKKEEQAADLSRVVVLA
jgi:hypothetical protein